MPHSTKNGMLKAITPECIKTDFNRQFVKKRASGMRRAEAFADLHEMGYGESLSTLKRQVRKFKTDGHAVLARKWNRQKPALDESQKQKIKDFIRAKNQQNIPIALRDVQKFTDEEFHKHLTLSYFSRLMKALGETLKKCRTRSSGHKDSNAVLRESYWKFILKVRKEDKMEGPELVGSLDATYTSEGRAEVHTWSGLGSERQLSNGTTPQHTNCIVTMVFADGKNHCPCEAWTSNKKIAPFVKDGVEVVRTPAKARKYEEFLVQCENFEIDPKRVHYSADSGLYTGESSKIYMEFLEMVDRDTVIFHDCGQAFKKEGKWIFDLMGFKHHYPYPSNVHQFLSPNDFHLHGVKSTWRNEYANFDDDLTATLRLMQLIDQDTVQNSKTYFRNNILHIKKKDLDRILPLRN